jgi:diadenosine tetraphosphate (Ap4A) HIT family hydrolase
MTPSENPRCGICGVIERIRAGKFPDFIAELDHSYVILGDAQFYRGYCILFAKRHEPELFQLPRPEALALSDELCSVAEAIFTVVKPLKMNYECLGNTEPHIHWHVFPRYQSEDEKSRRRPVWERPEAERTRALEPDDRRALIASIRSEIAKRISNARIPND